MIGLDFQDLYPPYPSLTKEGTSSHCNAKHHATPHRALPKNAFAKQRHKKKSNQDLQLTFIYRRYIWLVKWHWKKANKQIQNVEYSLEALI